MVIVIAKYKEDVSWAPSGSVIYDKTTYENVGRESEAFSRYIIENYNNIPNRVAFVQGNPFDHCPEFREKVRDYKGGIDFASNMVITCDINGCPHHCGLPMASYIQKYTPWINDNQFIFGAGAQYIVEKRHIISKPLSFWRKIHDSHWKEPLTPWIIERLWPQIWLHEE